MNCPDTGTLRAALDEPGALREPTLAEHLAGCAECRSALAELRRSAGLAAPALALLAAPETPTAEEVTAALKRDGSRRAGGDGPAVDTIEHGRSAHPSEAKSPDRWRRWSRTPPALRAAAVVAVVAVALGAVVATPTGRGAAASLLAQFRSERLAVVSFNPDDPGLRRGLWALQSIGTVDEGALTAVEPEQVASVEDASRRVGFEVRGIDTATLSRGAGEEPTIYVRPAQEVSFTFDREKARQYVAAHGQPEIKLPARFDGASLIVGIPAAAALVYRGPDRAPKVVVGQAGQLSVRTEGGVTLAEMREFLLGLPGLPEEAVRQLRAISDWRTTLPLFVPTGKVDWERTTVNGTQALSFSDRGGVMSAVVWQRDGRIYAVAGPIEEAEAHRVAAGLG